MAGGRIAPSRETLIGLQQCWLHMLVHIFMTWIITCTCGLQCIYIVCTALYTVIKYTHEHASPGTSVWVVERERLRAIQLPYAREYIKHHKPHTLIPSPSLSGHSLWAKEGNIEPEGQSMHSSTAPYFEVQRNLDAAGEETNQEINTHAVHPTQIILIHTCNTHKTISLVCHTTSMKSGPFKP